mgnify:CR=1 FL=1
MAIEAEMSSGNVFADVGLPDADIEIKVKPANETVGHLMLAVA